MGKVEIDWKKNEEHAFSGHSHYRLTGCVGLISRLLRRPPSAVGNAIIRAKLLEDVSGFHDMKDKVRVIPLGATLNSRGKDGRFPKVPILSKVTQGWKDGGNEVVMGEENVFRVGHHMSPEVLED